MFEGHSAPSDSHPDAVLSYDPKTRRYLLAYDYGNNNDSWDLVYRKGSQLPHSGAALAWAEHPRGPSTGWSAPFSPTGSWRGCWAGTAGCTPPR